MIHFPILIIGCPRSGTTLLFNILSEVPSLWSMGYESKIIIERHHPPSNKNWESGVLDGDDLGPTSRAYMLAAFEHQSASGTFWRRVNWFRGWLRGNRLWQGIKHRGRSQAAGASVSSAIPQQGLSAVRKLVQARNTLFPMGNKAIRLLEKTPENCLRLPFLINLFPDARIIYLTRDGRANVNSLMEGWRQPHLFPGYRVPGGVSIPGDTRDRWAFALIPGWRDLLAHPLEEVCAWQWIRCNETVLAHREATQGHVPYLTIRYEELVSDPGTILPQIANFIGVDFEASLSRFATTLPQINVVSTPDPDKWQKQNRASIERVLPLMRPMMERLGYNMA